MIAPTARTRTHAQALAQHTMSSRTRWRRPVVGSSRDAHTDAVVAILVGYPHEDDLSGRFGEGREALRREVELVGTRRHLHEARLLVVARHRRERRLDVERCDPLPKVERLPLLAHRLRLVHVGALQVLACGLERVKRPARAHVVVLALGGHVQAGDPWRVGLHLANLRRVIIEEAKVAEIRELELGGDVDDRLTLRIVRDLVRHKVRRLQRPLGVRRKRREHILFDILGDGDQQTAVGLRVRQPLHQQRVADERAHIGRCELSDDPLPQRVVAVDANRLESPLRVGDCARGHRAECIIRQLSIGHGANLFGDGVEVDVGGREKQRRLGEPDAHHRVASALELREAALWAARPVRAAHHDERCALPGCVVGADGVAKLVLDGRRADEHDVSARFGVRACKRGRWRQQLHHDRVKATMMNFDAGTTARCFAPDLERGFKGLSRESSANVDGACHGVVRRLSALSPGPKGPGRRPL